MALLAAYNFDEASGPVVDLTGNGHGWTLSGSSARTTGDGGHTDEGLGQTTTSNDTGPALFGQTPQRTLMFWLRTTSDFTGWIFEWHDNANDTGRWGLLCLGGNMGFRGTGPGGAVHASRARPTDNQWHHWAGTYDGTTLRAYFDGALVGSGSALAGGILTDADVIRVFTSAGSGNTIDDVRIYDEALDQSTIATLMNTPATSGPAPVDEITTSLPVDVTLGGELDIPTASVPQIAAAVPLSVALAGVLDAPTATVPDLGATLPVLVGIAGVLDAPASSVAALTVSLPIAVGMGGVLGQVTATVPTVVGGLTLELELGGRLFVPGSAEAPDGRIFTVATDTRRFTVPRETRATEITGET